MLTVTFSRTSTALAITDEPKVGLYLPEDALGTIVRRIQRTYGPASAYVRAPLLAVIEEASAVPLAVYARGNSAAHLMELREELAAAATQWRYDLTVDAAGVVTTYPAEPEMPVWELTHDSGAVRDHLDRCRLLIPVNL
jgi:hypothetical protein